MVKNKTALQAGFPDDVSRIDRRHANEISASALGLYLELDWLEWWDGTLRPTVLGLHVLQSEFERLAASHDGRNDALS